jgi:hypothetical protein
MSRRSRPLNFRMFFPGSHVDIEVKVENRNTAGRGEVMKAQVLP